MATDVDVNFGADLEDIKTELEGLKSYITGWGDTVKSIGIAAFAAWAASAGFAAIVSALHTVKNAVVEWMDAASEAEEVDKRLDISIRNAGSSFKYTSDQVKQMASDLQQNSTFGDEAIKQAQTTLIQMNLTGRQFRETTKAAVGLASMMGGDVTNSARTLGLALQFPERAALMLRRQGIVLEVEQRQQIATAVKAGDTWKAQGLLLEFVGKKAGEAGKEMSTTFAGMRAQISELVGDIKEELGVSILTVVKQAMPAIRTLTAHVLELAGELSSMFTDLVGQSGSQDWIDGLNETIMKLFSYVETFFRRLPGMIKEIFIDLRIELAELKQVLAEMNPFGDKERMKAASDAVFDLKGERVQILNDNAIRAGGVHNLNKWGVSEGWKTAPMTFTQEADATFARMKEGEARRAEERAARDAALDAADRKQENQEAGWRSKIRSDPTGGAMSGLFSEIGKTIADPLKEGGRILQKDWLGSLADGKTAVDGVAKKLEFADKSFRMGETAKEATKAWEDGILAMSAGLQRDNPFKSAIEDGAGVFNRIQSSLAGDRDIPKSQLQTQKEQLIAMREQIVSSHQSKIVLEGISAKLGIPQPAKAG